MIVAWYPGDSGADNSWLEGLGHNWIVVQLLSHVWLFVALELQHTRLLCPSLSPRACSDSCPSSWWCHLIISSSVTLFSSCPQSLSFPVSQLFASGGQSIEASTLAPVLAMNIQDWFPLWLTGLISLLSKGLPRVFSREKTRSWKAEEPEIKLPASAGS